MLGMRTELSHRPWWGRVVFAYDVALQGSSRPLSCCPSLPAAQLVFPVDVLQSINSVLDGVEASRKKAELQSSTERGPSDDGTGVTSRGIRQGADGHEGGPGAGATAGAGAAAWDSELGARAAQPGGGLGFRLSEQQLEEERQRRMARISQALRRRQEGWQVRRRSGEVLRYGS